VTEPGSPSARLRADSAVEGSISTTSYRRTSGESTLILNPTAQPIASTAEAVTKAATRAFPSAKKLTYIIVNNDSKQAGEDQRSAEAHASSNVDNVVMSRLSSHLQGIFDSGKFSDSQVVLNSAGEMFWSIIFLTHRVIISQNPVLGSLLDRVAALEQSKTTVYVMAGKKFALPRALEFALQHLYGMPLLNKDNVQDYTFKAIGWDKRMVEKFPADKMKEVIMDLALCYGAAGAFMNDARIVHAAFELALHSLDWANLEIALHFGIYPEDFLVVYDDTDEKNEGKAKKGKKGKKKAAKKVAELPPIYPNLNAQVLHKWAPKVAAAAVQFLANNLSATFLFDRLAVSKELQDRIPHEFRITLMNPGLASLKFGDHPQPSVNCTRASAVLLALPFARFRECLDTMRQKGSVVLTADLVRAVLQEREQRRLNALREYAKQNPGSKKTKSKDNSKEYPEWFKQELGYHEFAIEVQTPAEGGEMKVEFSLHREWKGNAEGGMLIRKFC
jgi:hypothetical protein